MSMVKRVIALFICMAAAVFISPESVSADTDGKEIQITDKPDQLILQLGPQWAGVEFELKTDAGIFPMPVLVDTSGVLKMDLGGSKTYTLSCITSSVSIPELKTTAEVPTTQISEAASADSPETGIDEVEADETREAVPKSHLILFIAGFAAAVGGLIAMWYYRWRREAYYNDYDDDDDGE